MERQTVNWGGEQFQIPKFSKRTVLTVIIGVLVVWMLLSAFYMVEADEVGVIQRFGKYQTQTQPGLHLKLPWGVDKVTKVKIQRVFKEEFGYRTVSAGVRTEYSGRDYSTESLMLTGDLNAALVEWIVQYRIKDPAAFLFNIQKPQATIRDVSESVMRQVVGNNSVDEVIIIRRKDIANEAQQLMQGLLDEYQTGIHIVTVNLQDVNPPVPVQPAFNEVNEARQEKERIINQAWERYNSQIPKAEGQAKQVVLEAEGYATNRINRAQGDAEKFIDVWREYNKAKDVTRRRLYIETMNEIFPKLDKKFILDKDVENLLPLLQLQGKGGSQ